MGKDTIKIGCAWDWSKYYNEIVIVCRYKLKEGFTSHIQADNLKESLLYHIFKQKILQIMLYSH